MKKQTAWTRFVSWLKHKLHRCAREGCWERGVPCFTSENDGKEPDEWVCGVHCHDSGYCRACGQFWGGVTSFDFDRSGLCMHCKAEDYDDQYGDNPDDGW